MDHVVRRYNMIEDEIISSEKSPIFMLKDLQKLYQEKIKTLGAPDDDNYRNTE